MMRREAKAFEESRGRVRCSKCLSELKTAGGEAVCPRCGQAGSVRLGDGSAAEFETGERRALPLAGLLAGLFLLAAGLGAAGWFWRADLTALVAAARPETVSAGPGLPGLPEPPDWRLDRRGAFEGPLAGGLIGIFGTRGDDRPQAFAALAGGELVTLLVTEGQDGGAPGAALVTVDGSPPLGQRPVALPDGFLGASLAASPDGGYYLALTGAGGVTLGAYGAGAAPVWERQVARSAPPGRRAEVIAADGQVYLAGAAESEGRLGIAAYGEDGALIWQRSFEAPEDGRLFASPRAAGGLFMAFETAFTEAGADVLALSLSASGETAAALSGLRIAGRLAGALPEAGGALILSEGPVAALSAFTADGALAENMVLPGAALQDTVRLTRLGDGEVAALSVYRLSDIQTDLTVSRRGGAQGAPAAARLRLPPAIEAGGFVLSGRSGLILAGRIGEGGDADAFLLALDLPGAPGEDASALPPAQDAAPAPAVPARPAGGVTPGPSAGSVSAQESPERRAQAGAPQPGEPAAGSGPRPEPEQEPEQGPGQGPEMRLCRFSCQDGESVFPLSRSLPADAARDEGGLSALHVAACQALGAQAADAVPPACSP